MLLHGGGVADVAAVLADVLHGSVAVLDSEGRRLAGAGDDLVDGIDDAVARARASGRSVAVDDADPPSYVAAPLAGTEHLGTLLLHGLTRELGPADRRTLERGALVTALVLLFSRPGPRPRSGCAASCSATCSSAATSTRPGCASGSAGSAPTSTPTVVAVALVEGVERHRAAQVAARLGGELDGLGGGARRPGGAGRPAATPLALGERLRGASAAPTVGVARRRRRCRPRSRRPTRGAAVPDTLLTLGRAGEVSDPAGLGLARLLLGATAARARRVRRPQVGPVLAYDERPRHRAGRHPRGVVRGRRPPGETAERLHVHPNTVAQRLDRVTRCSVRTGATRPGPSTSSWRCGCGGSAPTCEHGVHRTSPTLWLDRTWTRA